MCNGDRRQLTTRVAKINLALDRNEQAEIDVIGDVDGRGLDGAERASELAQLAEARTRLDVALRSALAAEESGRAARRQGVDRLIDAARDEAADEDIVELIGVRGAHWRSAQLLVGHAIGGSARSDATKQVLKNALAVGLEYLEGRREAALQRSSPSLRSVEAGDEQADAAGLAELKARVGLGGAATAKDGDA